MIGGTGTPRTPRGVVRIVGVVALAAWMASDVPAAAQAGPARALTAAQPRYLVVPFDNATDEPRVYWLGEGSAVVLADDLESLGAPVIGRDDRMHALERLGVPSVATLSHATVIRLGQIVGAARVVVGTFELRDEQLTVRARTIRLDTGRISDEIAEQGPLTEIFGIYGRVARRIVPDSPVTPEQMERVHPPLAAFEQFVKGTLAMTIATKIAYLSEALRLAPAFHEARLASWHAHAADANHAAALDTIRPVPADHELSRQARFLATVSMMHLGEYESAFDELTRLNTVRADPGLLNNLGVIQLRRPAGSPGGKAVVYFDDAAKLDDGDADLFFNLGYAYARERDLSAAAHWLREAVRRNPADAEAHHVLGAVLHGMGNGAEAARERELAARLASAYADSDPSARPDAIPAGLERIATRIDLPTALRVENVIVAAEQRDQQRLAAFHLEAGRRALEAERDAEATNELRRAIYLAPYEGEAHLLLGRVHLRGGRVRDAIDAFRISIWSQDTVEARLALAEALMQTRDVEAARREVQAVLNREPGNSRAQRMLEQLAQSP